MRALPLVASMLAVASVAAVDYTAEDITTKRANANPSVQVVTTSSSTGQNPFVRIADYQTGYLIGYPALRLEAGQGSETTKAAVLGSQYLGGVEWQGFGTSLVTGAAIYGVANTTWTASSTPARVGIFVNNGTALSEAVRIYPDGGMQVGGAYGTSPGTGSLAVATKGVFDRGTGALPGSINNPSIVLSNANGSGPEIESFGWASSGLNINARVADGTRSAPTATSSGRVMLNLVANGHNGTVYTTTPAARYQIIAESLWSSANQQTAHIWYGTPNGSTTAAEWMRLTKGGLAIGVTGLSGTEKLRVAGTSLFGGDVTTSYASTTWVKSTTQNTTSGTGAGASLEVVNNAGQATKTVVATYSGGFASTVFGTTAASYSFVGAAGTSSAGIMIGNYLIDKPIIFGINATEVARLTSGTLATGQLDIKYTKPSASTGAGALTVAGGMYLGGSLWYAGGRCIEGGDFINESRARSGSPTASYWEMAGSTGTIFGSVGFNGLNDFRVYNSTGATVQFQSTATGVAIPQTTASTTTTTGALVVSGGVGIAGAANIGGATKVSNTTASTSATTGALIVSGGLGVAGTINTASSALLTSNNTGLFFKDLSGSTPNVRVQNDNNMVLYSTSSTGTERAVFSVLARNDSSPLKIAVPTVIGADPGGTDTFRIGGSQRINGGLTIDNNSGLAVRFGDSGGNTGIEIGRTNGVASYPYIDLHSGVTTTDYDARIACSNGNGVTAGGNLVFEAARTVATGQVLVGTTTVNPNAAATDLLQVNGGVIAKKLTVTTNGFPDYVFAADYKLRPLSEVEAFIKDNKHLPGVPSEAQVVRDGLSVDGMIKHQMEKIEELTLYAIAQDKELAAQRAATAAARREAAHARQELADLLRRVEAIERQSH